MPKKNNNGFYLAAGATMLTFGALYLFAPQRTENIPVKPEATHLRRLHETSLPLENLIELFYVPSDDPAKAKGISLNFSPQAKREMQNYRHSWYEIPALDITFEVPIDPALKKAELTFNSPRELRNYPLTMYGLTQSQEKRILYMQVLKYP